MIIENLMINDFNVFVGTLVSETSVNSEASLQK